MAVYFSRQLSKRSAVRQLGLTSGAVRQLESYDFPNNIQVLPLCQLAHSCRSWAPCGSQEEQTALPVPVYTFGRRLYIFQEMQGAESALLCCRRRKG